MWTHLDYLKKKTFIVQILLKETGKYLLKEFILSNINKKYSKLIKTFNQIKYFHKKKTLL